MDHDSLRTASTYLNNLLLARGLLRNSEPIDFVKPSKESRAQIINLVHDLILREDRDKAGRESAADTIRVLRAEDHRKTHEIERLNSKAEDSARQCVAAQNAERTSRAEVQKVEKAMKTLQEQTAKIKTALAQVKTQCLNDVRKRDAELARLKTHLQGQQRGKSVGMSGPSLILKSTIDKKVGQRGVDIADPEYSLKQETTEFLTQLSQSLSDENDNLIGLIRNSLTTLRGLLGLPTDGRRHPDSAIGSMGSSDDGAIEHDKSSTFNMLHSLPTSYETLSTDMESAMSHLKELLTTPNFVSVEEVEIREEEISRLREGWDRMEQRWREVLQMMEGWRQRMDTGDTINIDEIRRGIGLVSPAASRERSRDDANGIDEQSFVSADVSEIRIDGLPETSYVEPSPSIPPTSLTKVGASKRKRDVIEPPDFFDLRPSSSSNDSRRSARTNPPSRLPQPSSSSFRAAGQKAKPSHDNRDLDIDTNIIDEDEAEAEEEVMTIEEKLSAAQAEAESAAAATTQPSANHLDYENEDDTLGKIPSPKIKRTRTKGRPRTRKRKSTLSPEELEALISGGDGVF